MSFIGYLNKPRMLMFDADDYIGSGFLGMPTGSYAGYAIKDLGSGSYSDWDGIYTTHRATRDAHFKAVHEFILATKAMYYDSADVYPSYAYFSTVPIDVGITEQGKIDFINAANNISNKTIDVFRDGIIFWNQIIKQKQTSIDISVRKYNYFNNWGNGPSYEEVYVPIVIDLAMYPTMTSQIYENYINTIKDYLFTVKTFVKIATNSDMEVVNPPFDFTIPYLPPLS